MTTTVVWISLHPKTCTIDVYPKDVSLKLEQEYLDCKQYYKLGKNYNNSVVHFYFGINYELTPKKIIDENGNYIYVN